MPTSIIVLTFEITHEQLFSVNFKCFTNYPTFKDNDREVAEEYQPQEDKEMDRCLVPSRIDTASQLTWIR